MSKKKIENPVVLDNLRTIRIHRGYTQQTLSECLNIGQDTYSDYELGKKPIPSNILTELSNILKVSCDYILGVSDTLNIGNKEIEDMTGLNEQAIENLRTFNANLLNNVALALVASEYGIVHIPYNPIDTLNMIINSPECEGLLSAIEDYISPEYNKPMCYVAAGEKVGGVTTKKADYHIPTNQIHKRGSDNFMPLVKDENTPTDYRAVKIDSAFLESVAMLQIQKHIDTIKSDYNQTKNGSDS